MVTAGAMRAIRERQRTQAIEHKKAPRVPPTSRSQHVSSYRRASICALDDRAVSPCGQPSCDDLVHPLSRERCPLHQTGSNRFPQINVLAINRR